MALCAAPEAMTRAAPEASQEAAPAPRTRQPRGRPRASARWDGTRWVLDPDAAEQAAKKLVAHRKNVQRSQTCNSRIVKANEAGVVWQSTDHTNCVHSYSRRPHVWINKRFQADLSARHTSAQLGALAPRRDTQRYEICTEQSVATARRATQHLAMGT